MTARYREMTIYRKNPVPTAGMYPATGCDTIPAKTTTETTIAARIPAVNPAFPAVRRFPFAMYPAVNPPINGPRKGTSRSMIIIMTAPMPAPSRSSSVVHPFAFSPEQTWRDF